MVFKSGHGWQVLQDLDQLLNKLNAELDAKDKTIIELKRQLAAAEKTNDEYGDMISTIDTNLMRAKSEGSIFKNDLYKTRAEIKPLKEVNIRLKVTNQNLTSTLVTLQSQHKR